MKKVRNIITVLLAVVAAASIPYFFINQESIISYLQRVFPLKVDERYTGGDISAEFIDPYGDDNGDGSLSYPAYEQWSTEGTLDLLKFTIHKPVTDGKWTSLRVFQQLDLCLAGFSNPLSGAAGFSNPVINIYIDIDGSAGGSTKTAKSRAELVSFSPLAPWDFVVSINGFSQKADLSSFDGSYHSSVMVYSSPSENSIYIRLPLEKNGLLPIMDGRKVSYYVVVGAYSQLAQGNFMNIKTRGSSRLRPRVFDYLSPDGVDQHKMLSSWNETSRSYAELKPVTWDPAQSESNSIANEELEKLKNLAEKELQSQPSKKLGEISQENLKGTALLIEYFNYSYFKEAESEADKILSEEPENAIALAYKGSITAMNGGKASSVIDSVNLVQKAYEIFDKTEEVAVTDEEKLTLYMNRGNVSKSIPESVFLKSLSGAKDFERAAQIFQTMDGENSSKAASALINAGECYIRAGKNTAAEVCFIKASSISSLSAADRYKLALRGFIQTAPSN